MNAAKGKQSVSHRSCRARAQHADRLFRDSEDPATRRKLRVLLAENDDGLRRLLAFALAIEGFEVIEACDGGELRCRMVDHFLDHRERRFDLVAAAVRLPGATSVEVFADLVELRGFPPVILTASREEPLCNEARALALPVLERPFELRQFVCEVWKQVGVGAR